MGTGGWLPAALSSQEPPNPGSNGAVLPGGVLCRNLSVPGQALRPQHPGWVVLGVPSLVQVPVCASLMETCGASV